MTVEQTLGVSCYRLASNVKLTQTENGGMVALCDYPLRIVPLNPTVAHLLELCTRERTCEQLATVMRQPLKRIEALCDQLRWKSLLEAGPIAPPTTWPPISIVIPSYNRANELARCLQSLFALDYPHAHVEILVVDDASTDHTSAMLRQLTHEAETYDIQLRSVRHTQQQGVAISRNTGAAASTHDLIAYIDSDCVASSTWLTELIPLFQDDHVAAVGGGIRGYDRQSLLGRYEDTCSSLYMGARPQQVRLEGPLKYLPTANLLLRRAIWQQLGGFAPLTQGEDVDFCRRVLLSGAHIRYIPQGVVYHDYRTTLKSFLKIRTAYATAEAALLQRHPTERRILVLPPEQATFAGLVLGGLWGMFCALLFTKKHSGGVEHSYVEHDGAEHDLSIVDFFGGNEGMFGRDRLIASKGRGGAHVPAENRCRHVAPSHLGRNQSVPTGISSRLTKTLLLKGEHDRGKPCHYYTTPYAWRSHEIPCIVVTGLAPVMLRPVMLLLGGLIAAVVTTLFGTQKRLQKIQKQQIPIISPIIVLKATLRGNLAYTYHLCRHLTRYYTLPLLLLGIIFFPVNILVVVMLSIVISVDYWRLKPSMNIAQYALCAILNDCAYEVGIVQGCIKHKTWKPLMPILKKRV